MAFDLYFAGSRTPETDEYIEKHNFNRLYSQYNDRKAIKQRIESSCTGKLLIDSGAFSAHTKDAIIDVDEYVEYINSIKDSVTLFVQVDCIPGKFGKPKTEAERKEAPKKSWENYLYMRDKVDCPDKLIPVFHQGENMKWLQNMLEFTDNGHHIPYIGISPANDTTVQNKIAFIDRAFKIIKNSSNPQVKTHAFGMTSLPVLEKYPFTSADSTTWIMVGAMGNVLTPWGLINCSDRIINSHNILVMEKKSQTILIEYFEKNGYSLEQVIKEYSVRMILNCKYLKNWANNYVYRPYTNYKRNLI